MLNSDGWLGSLLIAGGGGAAVAFGIFRTLGNKWLDGRFGSRLEALRHENAKETERLKLQMSQRLDRATKLTQREFEALPELWEATVDAVTAAQLAYVRFSRHSDLSGMSDEDAEDYVTRIEVPPHHRKEILSQPPRERNGVLGRAQSLRHVAEAWTKAIEAQSRLRRLAIFLPEDLLASFNELVDLTRRAVIDADMRSEEGLKRADLVDAERLRKEGDDLLRALEAKVRARLQSQPDEDHAASRVTGQG